MEKRPIVVIGDANVDLVIQMPKSIDVENIEKSQAEPNLYGGGSAANVAVAISRLGSPVEFIGGIGDDGYGKYVRDDLISEKVGTEGLHTIPNSFTPMVIATIMTDGERMIVVWPPERDADLKLDLTHIDEDLISNSGWLHTSGMCLRASPVRETILESMKIAKEHGIPTSLDLNLRLELWGWEDGIRETTEKAMTLSDYVFGNAAEEIIPISNKNNLEEALTFLSLDQKTIVARKGSSGSTAMSDGKTIETKAYPSKAIDTLGAGDAFCGGFIVSRMEGSSLEEALQWGNAVASLQINQPGARGVPSSDQVRSVLEENK